MAAPNMLALNSITGSSVQLNLAVNTEVQLLSNAAASSQLFKVNCLFVANVDGTNPFTITVKYYPVAALGGTATVVASTINIPANSTINILDKDSHLYLPENTSLGVTASTGNKLNVTCTYE